jgi:peptide/nickel transport system permease protein
MIQRGVVQGAVATTGRPVRPKLRRSIDWALVVGTIAIAVMVGLALYGPIIAPQDPWDTHFLFQGKVPPYDPSPTFPLGTDGAGRDRLSLLLWGARNTFLVAFGAGALRLGMGAFLGVFAGWHGGTEERWLARLAVGLSSVPATIAALLAVIAFNVYAGALAFILALGLVGWGDAFHHARRATRTESARPFIETARTLGMSEQRVVLRHLLPNIAPALLTVGALQVSAVLLLLGELALIRIFLGGATTIDLFVQPLNLPTDPEWASLLGTTRPIYDLYGNTVAVLAPIGALLAAVVSINLFADALAQRAQRLDVFRLFSSRQALAFGVIALFLVAPALLWPNRLADELHYADRFSPGPALELTQAFADPRFEGRVAQTPGAAAAAELLRSQMGGALLPIHEQIVKVDAARATVAGRSVSLGPDLSVLTTTNADVTASLVNLVPSGGSTLGGTQFNRAIEGRIVIVATNVQASVSVWEGFVGRGGARGLIVLTDTPMLLFPSGDYPVPTIAMTPSAFRTLLGVDLPVPPTGQMTTPVDITVGLQVSAPSVAIGGVDVVARIEGRAPGGPLLLVAAPYDTTPSTHYLDYPLAPNEASAAATLAAAAEAVRSAPLSADVLFVAVGSVQYDWAGLKAVLHSLSPADSARLAAVVWIPSALGARVSLQPDPSDAQNPSASARVAGRVAAALGEAVVRQSTSALPRTLAAVGARAPTFQIGTSATDDTAPSEGALHATGRAVLAVLAYIADHPESLK